MKVVINRCYGGFGLSPTAELWLYEKGFDEGEFKTSVKEYFRNEKDTNGLFNSKSELEKWRGYLKNMKKGSNKRDSLFVTTFSPDEKYVLNGGSCDRSHPLVVECVETLKEKANGSCASLKVIEIPDGMEYEIEEYDGMEHIAESHRTWE